MSFIGNVDGCLYEESFDQEVDRSENAHYYINTTNNDHPFGIDVRIDISQTISTFAIENQAFHLNIGDNETTHIIVHTDVDNEVIETNFSIFEKEESDSEYQEVRGGKWNTTIIHPPLPPPPDPDEDRSNIFLGVLGAPLAIIILYLIVRWRIGSLVLVPQYSLLKKDEMFQNPNRKAIFQTLADSEHGLTTKNVQDTTGINIGTVRHHLKILENHGYVGKTDKVYYLRPGGARKTFYQQILVAQENGATTIREVAKVLDTSTHRVWYHIRKNG